MRGNSPRRKNDGIASLFLLFTFLLSYPIAANADEPTYLQAIAPRTWSFPRDHGRHDGFKTEWWYFTGNLREKSTNRRFGYQLTFFRTAITPDAATTRASPWALHDLYFAHFAISDIANKQFLFKDRLERGRPELAESSAQTLDVHLLDWSAHLDSSNAIHLQANEPTMALNLICQNDRAPILEGPGGVNSKGPARGQASYYYSMTRLPTNGTLSINGKDFTVDGSTWMDHEFSSNALSENQVGWDWMGLRLTDGNDLMIYRLRDKTGNADYLSGTLTHPDGTPQYLSKNDIQITGSTPWTSNQTHAVYPQLWSLQVRGLPPMTIQSLMPGQELITGDSTKVSYFEGAAEVQDSTEKPIGEGYLEMTGYAEPLTGNGLSGNTKR